MFINYFFNDVHLFYFKIKSKLLAYSAWQEICVTRQRLDTDDGYNSFLMFDYIIIANRDIRSCVPRWDVMSTID